MRKTLKGSPMAVGSVRIGVSGWTYPPWRGVFYPRELPQKRELNYAASIFRSIEINGTFYSLQRPSSFKKWADATPDDFIFSVKGGRFITHMKRLTNVRAPLANFLASGLLRLGPKLGPVLWQLPANFRFDEGKLENFLKILPRDTEEASKMARRHDSRLKVRAWTKTDAKCPMRHALEVRHESFRTRAFIDLLRAYGVALVCADTVEWPRLMDITADFVYCRLHGSKELYASGYDDAALDIWSRRVADWARGREPVDAERVIDRNGPKRERRDVYFYFDNDKKVCAPFDGMKLQERVSKLLRAAQSI